MTENKLVVNKAFFGGKQGAKNCLKVTLNKDKECYFNFGIEEKDKKYKWIPVKFQDTELGEILHILSFRKNSVAFFHSFKGKGTETKRQIWVNRSDDKKTVFVKIKELTKPLSMGEQKVLEILLTQIIAKMNL